TVKAAGDNIIVAAGVYYELLTVGLSGTVGSPCTWTGDYLGAIFTSVGSGVVRLTGAAANEQSASRANCITATSKNYNNFNGFMFDTSSSPLVSLGSCQNWTFNNCVFHFSANGSHCISCSGLTQSTIKITNSW